jgi:DNA-directed RNA polymerase subunit K/omega
MGNLVDSVGGAFRLTAVIQKRMRELVKGARPLVEVARGRKDLLEIAARELQDGRIEPVEGVREPTPKDIFKTESLDEGE